MKKMYTGLKAEKIDFGSYDSVIKTSIPSSCIQIVANVVAPGGSECQNPTDTTSYMYINNRDPSWN